MKQQINDSGFNTESDYEYSTINQAMTPVSLTISAHHPTGGTSGGGSLPKSCLTPIKVRNEKSENNSDRDSSDDEKRVPNVPLFRKQYYLNSTEFMAHFRKNVFPNELGLVMGFSKKQIYQSKFARDRIFLFDAAYQIVPAITLPWPGILAYEWMWRDRKAGKYVWPTKTMITDVSRLFCQACPNGFLPKRGANPNRSLEWEVTFPRAEKYLETRMSHAQIKAYLYLLTLLKAFVEPKTGNHGLLPRHVRTLMFWECEADYVRWPESRLGSKLLLVLKHLCLNLGNAHLPDYFVKNKNLFGSIPGMYLRSAQEALAKIIEFPVMYFLVALQSLTYVSPGQFYPLPDFERLHKILTSDGLDLGDTKPLLLKKTGTRCKKSREGREQAWNRRYLVQQQKLRKEKLRPKQEDKMNLEAQHSIIPEEFKKVGTCTIKSVSSTRLVTGCIRTKQTTWVNKEAAAINLFHRPLRSSGKTKRRLRIDTPRSAVPQTGRVSRGPARRPSVLQRGGAELHETHHGQGGRVQEKSCEPSRATQKFCIRNTSSEGNGYKRSQTGAELQRRKLAGAAGTFQTGYYKFWRAPGNIKLKQTLLAYK